MADDPTEPAVEPSDLKQISSNLERIRVPIESGTDYQIVTHLLLSMRNNSFIWLTSSFFLFAITLHEDIELSYTSDKVIDLFGLKLPYPVSLIIITFVLIISTGSMMQALMKLKSILEHLPKEQINGALKIVVFSNWMFNPFSISPTTAYSFYALLGLSTSIVFCFCLRVQISDIRDYPIWGLLALLLFWYARLFGRVKYVIEKISKLDNLRSSGNIHDRKSWVIFVMLVFFLFPILIIFTTVYGSEVNRALF